MTNASLKILLRKPTRKAILGLALLLSALTNSHATVAVSPLYGSNMVLQRGQALPVWGTAAPNKSVTVTFNGQTESVTADAQGNWQVTLDPMTTKPVGGSLTIAEAGANTITLANVVVGDVWLCSGQSNMAFSLGGCNRPSDISSANFPGIRSFTTPLANLGELLAVGQKGPGRIKMRSAVVPFG